MGREPVDAGKVAGAGLVAAVAMLGAVARFSDDCGRAAVRVGSEAHVVDDLGRAAAADPAAIDDLARSAGALRTEAVADDLGRLAEDLAPHALDAAEVVTAVLDLGGQEALLVTAPPDQVEAARSRCSVPCLVVAEGFDAAPWWRATAADEDPAAFVARVGRELPPEARAAWSGSDAR
jgi:hypothetical protein